MAGCHHRHHYDYHHQLLKTGGAVGFYSGNLKTLTADMKALKPTILPAVPRFHIDSSWCCPADDLLWHLLPQPGSWTGSTIAASQQQTKAVFSGITSSHVTNEQWFLENIFYNFLFFKAHLQLCPFFEDRRTLQGDCAQRLNLGQANLLVGISVYFSTFLKITHIL